MFPLIHSVQEKRKTKQKQSELMDRLCTSTYYNPGPCDTWSTIQHGWGQILWIVFKYKYFEELKYKIQNTNTFLDLVFQIQIQILLNCITITVAKVLHGKIYYTWRTLVLLKFCPLNNICWVQTSFLLCYTIFELTLKIHKCIHTLELVLQVCYVLNY